MICTLLFSLLGLTTQLVSTTPVELEKRATPTVYLAGDSTMARLGGNNGKTDGTYFKET